ncbi:MAG: hypothetical protein IPL46_13715 [Saprospiraceae bacterium]|nr:hypothetical protein [Saprospiraceae bacterium]
MISKLTIVFVLTLLACAATDTDSERISGYNLSKPDFTSELPDTLREISGLTDIDNTTFACIQDEKGILFIYDISKNEILRQDSFNIDGDYEGITRVDSSMYILRSDGTLFEISNYQSSNFKLTSFATGIPANNNEGLCYDPDNDRLLIASKGKIAKGPKYKDKRVIYGFDLKTKKLTNSPLFEFDIQTIVQYAADKKINLPARPKKNGQISEPFIKFMTSAIAVHPITKKLYLLSASDHLFFMFDMEGNIEHLELLNPEIFNKAEGITFLDNGDMLIANEGQDKKPTLLRFNYKNI